MCFSPSCPVTARYGMVWCCVLCAVCCVLCAGRWVQTASRIDSDIDSAVQNEIKSKGKNQKGLTKCYTLMVETDESHLDSKYAPYTDG